jgi:reactive intermediate/imine deaminase
MSEPRRKQAMNPLQVARPFRGYYSNCVRVSAGPLLFIAGQVAWDREGKLVGKGDVKKQAAQALENIRVILEANGATMDDVVKVTVYVTDMKYLDDITEVRMKYFPKDGPASVLVEVSRLVQPDLLIEIEAVAAVK